MGNLHASGGYGVGNGKRGVLWEGVGGWGGIVTSYTFTSLEWNKNIKGVRN